MALPLILAPIGRERRLADQARGPEYGIVGVFAIKKCGFRRSLQIRMVGAQIPRASIVFVNAAIAAEQYFATRLAREQFQYPRAAITTESGLKVQLSHEDWLIAFRNLGAFGIRTSPDALHVAKENMSAKGQGSSAIGRAPDSQTGKEPFHGVSALLYRQARSEEPIAKLGRRAWQHSSVIWVLANGAERVWGASSFSHLTKQSFKRRSLWLRCCSNCGMQGANFRKQDLVRLVERPPEIAESERMALYGSNRSGIWSDYEAGDHMEALPPAAKKLFQVLTARKAAIQGSTRSNDPELAGIRLDP